MSEIADIAEFACPCCDSQLRISTANLDLLMTAVAGRQWAGTPELDISRVPADIDMTGPLSAEDIDRVVAAAFSDGGATDG